MGLNEVLKNRGWRPEQLAIETGLSFSTIRLALSKNRDVSTDSKYRISKALGVPLEELFPELKRIQPKAIGQN